MSKFWAVVLPLLSVILLSAAVAGGIMHLNRPNLDKEAMETASVEMAAAWDGLVVAVMAQQSKLQEALLVVEALEAEVERLEQENQRLIEVNEQLMADTPFFKMSPEPQEKIQ
jgi:hypothetical protein